MSWRAIRWAMEAGKAAQLTTVQRTVLWALAYHHNDKTGACNPSVETLADAAGLSPRAVQYATAHLARVGLVTISPRARHGIQTSNQFDLFGKPKGRTTCTRGGAPNGRAGVHHVHPNLSSPKGGTPGNVLPFGPRREAQR